jgi:hypothetical protein
VSVSAREPASIQTPTVAVWANGCDSVATVKPFGRVVICVDGELLAPAAVAYGRSTAFEACAVVGFHRKKAPGKRDKNEHQSAWLIYCGYCDPIVLRRRCNRRSSFSRQLSPVIPAQRTTTRTTSFFLN